MDFQIFAQLWVPKIYKLINMSKNYYVLLYFIQICNICWVKLQLWNNLLFSWYTFCIGGRFSIKSHPFWCFLKSKKCSCCSPASDGFASGPCQKGPLPVGLAKGLKQTSKGWLAGKILWLIDLKRAAPVNFLYDGTTFEKVIPLKN